MLLKEAVKSFKGSEVSLTHEGICIKMYPTYLGQFQSQAMDLEHGYSQNRQDGVELLAFQTKIILETS